MELKEASSKQQVESVAGRAGSLQIHLMRPESTIQLQMHTHRERDKENVYLDNIHNVILFDVWRWWWQIVLYNKSQPNHTVDEMGVGDATKARILLIM